MLHDRMPKWDDVNDAEVEQYSVSEGIVKASDTETDVPTEETIYEPAKYNAYWTI